jgi:ABC-2 type transport system ATP-binding protein
VTSEFFTTYSLDFESNDSAVQVSDLRRVFRGRGQTGEIVALDKVNLEVKKGEIFGLLGPNGAGKTTLIKILSTILLPSSGNASVLGMDVTKNPTEIRKRINLVSGGETPGYGSITVRENLWFFSQLYGLEGEIARANRKTDQGTGAFGIPFDENA